MTKFSLDRSLHLDRPVVARPVNGDGTDSNGRVGLDAWRVTRDEALELMAHHLQLAHMYYQATPVDETKVRAEVERLLNNDIPGLDDPALVGARAFLLAVNKFYADLKREQDASEKI